MSYRFFALPGHLVATQSSSLPTENLVEPSVPSSEDALERALGPVEFRDDRARDRLRRLVAEARRSRRREGDPVVVFARPPDDLPALLRLADQLESLATQDAGEQAYVWRCECGTRYAVPVELARPVCIRCDRCSRPLELREESSLGREALVDANQRQVNTCRRRLAAFFREAMARGWPVLVAASDNV